MKTSKSAQTKSKQFHHSKIFYFLEKSNTLPFLTEKTLKTEPSTHPAMKETLELPSIKEREKKILLDQNFKFFAKFRFFQRYSLKRVSKPKYQSTPPVNIHTASLKVFRDPNSQPIKKSFLLKKIKKIASHISREDSQGLFRKSLKYVTLKL